MRNLLASALITAMAASFPAAAATTSIALSDSDVGATFTVNFDGNVNTTTIADLNSKADFELVSVTNSGATWTFDIDVEMLATGGVGARMSGIGFNTDPNISSATTSGLFNIAVLGGSFPNGFGALEVCFKGGGGPSNCQGGGSGGTFTTGSFIAVLNFAAPTTNLTMDNFGVRYQSITGVATCGQSTDCGSGTGMGILTVVPEPGTWSLMILAFGLLGELARRRRCLLA